MLDLFYQTFSHFFLFAFCFADPFCRLFARTVDMIYNHSQTYACFDGADGMFDCFFLSLTSLIYLFTPCTPQKRARAARIFPFCLIVASLSCKCQSFSARIRNKFG